MITRLLVGILTPAMRATVVTPAAGAGNRPADDDFLSFPLPMKGLAASDNTTPSPVSGARHRFNVSDWMWGF
jgi:hypothetical protein